MKVRISLEALAPISISRGRATGNELETAGHIPGATWRGALAAYMIDECGLGKTADADPEFRQLFLSGETRFGDLRVDGCEPWPLSSRGCTRNDDHPITDLLIETGRGGALPEDCKRCEGKIGLPKKEGYSIDDYGQAVAVGPRRRTTAHTAMSARTLRVRDKQLFATEVLERGEIFRGEMRCSSY